MMLRNFILGIFALALIAVAAAAVAGQAPWIPVLGLAVVVLLMLFERSRYAGQVSARLEPLTPTGERFIDPTTGQPIQVWTNEAGERAYIEETRQGEPR
jgi:hypothetical protein